MADVRIAGFGKSITKPVKNWVPYSCRDRIQPSRRSQFSARPLRGCLGGKRTTWLQFPARGQRLSHARVIAL
jgi:hypothetical protein